MISKNSITALVEQALDGKEGYFIVEVKVSATKAIKVFIDNDKHVSIADCVAVSRFIEKSLDREVEDFELEVSSPGMDQPFRVFRQFLKALNRQVKVLEKDGTETEGVLKVATEEFVEIEMEAKKTKKAKLETELPKLKKINQNNIKEIKKIITFK
jgi:ribosome maturation factor RimP